MNYNSLLDLEKWKEALDLLLDLGENGILFAIWETFYVTLLSTFFALVIGLPLGRLLLVFIMFASASSRDGDPQRSDQPAPFGSVPHFNDHGYSHFQNDRGYLGWYYGYGCAAGVCGIPLHCPSCGRIPS